VLLGLVKVSVKGLGLGLGLVSGNTYSVKRVVDPALYDDYLCLVSSTSMQ